MNCQQADERLQDLLDSRTDPKNDDQLQSHLNDCADCRRMEREYSILFGMDAQADLISAASASRPGRSLTSDGPAGWKVVRSLTVIAGVFVLVVMPALWGARESNRTASRDYSVVQPPEHANDVRTEHPTLPDEFSLDGEINVASVLDIGSAFNSLSLIANDVDSEFNIESMDTGDRNETDSGMNPVGRMLTSFFPGKSLPQADMPGEATTMEMMSGSPAMSDLMQPFQFEQPTLKEVLRVCSNPFSQS